MSEANNTKYRIVEHMGRFLIQQSYVTLFGRVRWGTWQRPAMWEARYLYDHEFDTFKEAKEYLYDILAAWKIHDEQKKRGPVVHLEVTV